MSVELQNLVTRYTADTRQFDQAQRRIESQTQSHVNKVNQTLGRLRDSGGRFTSGGSSGGGLLPGLSNISNIISAIPQVGQLMGSLLSPIRDAAEEGIRFNAFLESSKIGFETLMKSADAADKHIAALQIFAEKTPFQFESLVKASQLMQAMKFGADEVIPSLKGIGDAISSTGEFSEEKLQGVITALGQIRLKGRVQAEEMMQLTERGIDAWGLLARAIGKTTEETMKLGQQGKLRGKEATQAIIAMMQKDFGGMMERQSSTLLGRLSNVEDIYQRASGLATQGLTKNINEAIGAALEKSDVASQVASSLDRAITPASGLITGAVKTALGGGITSGLKEGMEAGQELVKKATLTLGMDGVISPFKNLLGIHSPSTVFQEFGLNCAEGFYLGLQDGLRKNSKQDSRREALDKAASILGISAVDLAAIIGFETGGTFSPNIVGGAGNKYRGLIQFGPQEQKQYGVFKGQSFEDQLLNAVVPYFQDRFKSVGRETKGATLLDLYRTVLGGNPEANPDTKDAFGTSANSGVAKIIRDFIPLVIKKFFSDEMALGGLGGLEMYQQPMPSSARSKSLQNYSFFNFMLGREPKMLEDPVLKALFENRQDIFKEQADKAKEYNDKRKQINYEQRNNPQELIKQLTELKAGYDDYLKESSARLATINEQLKLNYNALKQYKPAPDMTVPEEAVPYYPELPIISDERRKEVMNLLPADSLTKGIAAQEPLYFIFDLTKQIGESALQTQSNLEQLGEGEWADKVIQKAEGIKKRFDDLKNSLPDLREELNNVFVSLPEQIGDVFANAVSNWDGTLKGFFKSVGQGFADLMRQIAAQLIKMMVMKLVLNLIGGFLGGGASGGFDESFVQGQLAGFGMGGFAEGGRPPIGVPSIVGEKGWEVFVPDEPGTVLNHRDSKEFIRNISRNNFMSSYNGMNGNMALAGGGSSNQQVTNVTNNYSIPVTVQMPRGSSQAPPSERQMSQRIVDSLAARGKTF